jgi:hypothetical protein
MFRVLSKVRKTKGEENESLWVLYTVWCGKWTYVTYLVMWYELQLKPQNKNWGGKIATSNTMAATTSSGTCQPCGAPRGWFTRLRAASPRCGSLAGSLPGRPSSGRRIPAMGQGYGWPTGPLPGWPQAAPRKPRATQGHPWVAFLIFNLIFIYLFKNFFFLFVHDLFSPFFFSPQRAFAH